MTQATPSGRLLDGAAAFLVHFVHGGVVLAAFLALACVATQYIHQEPLSYDDLQAAEEETSATVAPVATPAAPAAEPLKQQHAAARLTGEMTRVRDFVARQYKVSTHTLEPMLAAAETSGRKLGIDPLLIVAVMAIESKFNPFAESSMGAQGLMQVIPRFHLDKIGKGAGEGALFDPMLNIRVGTQVLVEGMKRFGSMQTALQYYGGALDDPDASYANKVLALKRRLTTAAERTAAERQQAPASGA
ncbi:transglycosylase SLT domain-containing protein [Azoarcus sp. KH32C]|uniref:transglycosylase SLT domain-containing protein n=1 Tax=Azoarcus sp. KH32C TaxID=748247 RepID=UPI00023860EC|nr:transglycosylase SLT domain-containing protein [Azoarcus sp. KH32C]BAL22976.1 transglycosylase [Azoarcus sp. KH32C]